MPTADDVRLAKLRQALERKLLRSLPGLTVTISRSRHASGPDEFERAVRESRLALNVGEAEGRERLGLGIKVMRVLGIASPRGRSRERSNR